MVKKIKGCIINKVYHNLTEQPYDDMDESDNPYNEDDEY